MLYARTVSWCRGWQRRRKHWPGPRAGYVQKRILQEEEGKAHKLITIFRRISIVTRIKIIGVVVGGGEEEWECEEEPEKQQMILDRRRRTAIIITFNKCNTCSLIQPTLSVGCWQKTRETIEPVFNILCWLAPSIKYPVNEQWPSAVSIIILLPESKQKLTRSCSCFIFHVDIKRLLRNFLRVMECQ